MCIYVRAKTNAKYVQKEYFRNDFFINCFCFIIVIHSLKKAYQKIFVKGNTISTCIFQFS